MHLEAISSLSCYWLPGRRVWPHLATSSSQGVVESKCFTSIRCLPFLLATQWKQSTSPQWFPSVFLYFPAPSVGLGADCSLLLSEPLLTLDFETHPPSSRINYSKFIGSHHCLAENFMKDRCSICTYFRLWTKDDKKIKNRETKSLDQHFQKLLLLFPCAF